MKAHKYIGKPMDRSDGRAKATGLAQYSDDLIFPNAFYGTILHSKYANARIISIETEKAKAFPGVVDVFTAKDIKNNNKYFRMGTTHDTWILADQYVRYIGDMLAFVVARDEKVAKKAMELIKVTYEPLPAVVSLEEAHSGEMLARDDKPANVAMPISVTRGNVDNDFSRASLIVDGQFSYPSLHQLHLEPNSVTAEYKLGKLKVYCASQMWFHLREDISAVTGIEEKNIEIVPMVIGGAFGARNDQPLPVIAALLASLTNGTVRMVNTRLEEFLATRPSVAMNIEIELALDDEGHFLSKKTKLISGFGAFSSDSDAVTAIAALRADNNYRFNSIHVDATGLYTNHTPTGAYRGFGNPQMHFALEQTIDIAAEKLKIDPTDIRMLNYCENGETSIHGFVYKSNGIRECMQRAKVLMDWDAKKRNPVPGRGLGVASIIHCAGSRAGKPEFSGSSALLKLDSTGNLTVIAGESEIGQGMNTIAVQIVAEELGVNPNEVNVIMGDTSLAPFSTGTNGSKLTSNLGNAILFACRDLKRKILKRLREEHGYGPLVLCDATLFSEYSGERVMSLKDAAELLCYARAGLPVVGKGIFNPNSELGDSTGYGNLAPAYVFGVQMAEVLFSSNGTYTVEKIVSVHDIGRVLNPPMARGQVYGGVMQGLGSVICEDLAINDDGIFEANTILSYKPLTIEQLPEIVIDFVETNDPFGPYGAKCIAEPPAISVAAAVANAIYDASGLRFDQLPITPARIQQKMLRRNAGR